MKLSKHFSLEEMTKTSVKGVSNLPPQEVIENLKRLCEWLEHLRAQYNLLYSDGSHPIIINSGYRSEAVNKKVGGSPTSNHLTGCAVDIKVFGIEEALRYAVILLNYADLADEKFDELLIERSPRGTYWLHFAVRPPLRQAQGPVNRRHIRFIQT